jgi:two-component system, OmpR family, heavy metal sensor histidine kinase CusS
MRSLRTRLFVCLIGGNALLFLVAGFAVSGVIAAWLRNEFDRGLEAKARALVGLTEQEAGRVEFDFRKDLMPEFGNPADPEYFELWLAEGLLFRRSPSFELSDETRRATLLRSSDPAATPRFRDLRLPDGRRGRQVQLDFVPAPDPDKDPDDVSGAPTVEPGASTLRAATLIVARERERLDADLRWLKVAVGIVAVALLLLLAGLTQVTLRVGLRALDRLNQQVRALDVTSLGTRVQMETPPDEIAVVVEQVNALLDRLEAGFQRERRLSSDIAHELKTPIAELRSLCEVGARWPGDRAAVRGFFGDAWAIALQMERVVAHLLALARYDEGREQVWTTRVPVAEGVEAAWKPLAREAAAKRLEFRQEISPALCFDTDPDKFASMVANILSNAVAYSPSDTAVVCRSSETNGGSLVSFSNRAENLEPQDLAVMFDRFWRKDEARGGGRNVGLGLSLVRAWADLLSIEIATRLDPDATFHITLGQKRNCTSMPTAQAPSVRPGKAAPGMK